MARFSRSLLVVIGTFVCGVALEVNAAKVRERSLKQLTADLNRIKTFTQDYAIKYAQRIHTHANTLAGKFVEMLANCTACACSELSAFFTKNQPTLDGLNTTSDRFKQKAQVLPEMPQEGKDLEDKIVHLNEQMHFLREQGQEPAQDAQSEQEQKQEAQQPMNELVANTGDHQNEGLDFKHLPVDDKEQKRVGDTKQEDFLDWMSELGDLDIDNISGELASLEQQKQKKEKQQRCSPCGISLECMQQARGNVNCAASPKYMQQARKIAKEQICLIALSAKQIREIAIAFELEVKKRLKNRIQKTPLLLSPNAQQRAKMKREIEQEVEQEERAKADKR